MQIIENRISGTWLKASIIGSIWASFEIVFGSFLHNIRFPMSGTILTIVAIIVMVTFARMWYEKGLLLKSAIITALMKSISPSAVLIGPMSAIFIEGLLMGIAIIIFGKNKFSYVIGGILALYSVLIHKIITLLILYGFDIVKISENLYFFIVKQLHINNLSFIQALLIISSFYVIAGFFAAFAGIKISNKAYSNEKKQNNLQINTRPDNFFKINKKQKFSINLLFINIFSIIIIFIFLNLDYLKITALLTFFYIIFCFLRYKQSLRHLKKVGFWLQLAVIITISILFYNETQTKLVFDKAGLIAGLSMGLRMIVLVVGFSTISIELRNPIVKAVLYRKGMGSIYKSLSLAFSVLPAIIEQNTNPKDFLKKPVELVAKMVISAKFLLETFQKQDKERKTIIITGEKGRGKSTFLLKLNKILKAQGIEIGGFIAQGLWLDKQRSGFVLLDIEHNKEIELATTAKKTDLKVGRFYFNRQAFIFGNRLIISQLETKNIFFIDEVGYLELNNGGWSKIIEKLFENNKIQVWTVRQNLVKEAMRRFAVTKAYIFDINTDTPIDVADLLLMLRNNLSKNLE